MKRRSTIAHQVRAGKAYLKTECHKHLKCQRHLMEFKTINTLATTPTKLQSSLLNLSSLWVLMIKDASTRRQIQKVEVQVQAILKTLVFAINTQETSSNIKNHKAIAPETVCLMIRAFNFRKRTFNLLKKGRSLMTWRILINLTSDSLTIIIRAKVKMN